MGLRFRHIHGLLFASAVFAATGCGGGGTAFATFEAYNFPHGKGGQDIDPSFSAAEGDAFTIVGGKNVVVIALAVEAADPNQADRQVALIGPGGSILATTPISKSDTLIDGYHYKNIAPVTLTSGTQYVICELHLAGTVDNYIWNTNVAETPNYIQDDGTVYCATGSIFPGMSFNPSPPRHYSASFTSYQVNQ